jgi:hypothetical protein
MERAYCDGFVCGTNIKKGSIPSDVFNREELKEWLINHIRAGSFTTAICGINCVGSWFFTGNHECMLDENGNYTGFKKVEMINAATGETKWVDGGEDLELCTPPVVVNNPDYVVMRYFWTGADGDDLDSATLALGSGLAVLDGKVMGWNMPNNSDSGLSNYMRWGGDNMSSGQETVMLDLVKLRDEYENVNENFNVELYANWYERKLAGHAVIQVTAYKGGVMGKSGTQWVNIGGETLIDSVPVNINVSASGKMNYVNWQNAYSHVGRVNYRKINPANEEFEITISGV